MPERRRLTPDQTKAARKRLDAGAGLDEVGAELGCSGDTVARAVDRQGRTLRRKRLDGRMGSATNSKPKRRTGSRSAGAPDGSARDRIERLIEDTSKLREEAHAKGNMTAFERLARLEGKLLAELEALDRQRPPDPALDPANRAARDTVLRLLDGLLEGTVEPTVTRTGDG